MIKVFKGKKLSGSEREDILLGHLIARRKLISFGAAGLGALAIPFKPTFAQTTYVEALFHTEISWTRENATYDFMSEFGCFYTVYNPNPIRQRNVIKCSCEKVGEIWYEDVVWVDFEPLTEYVVEDSGSCRVAGPSQYLARAKVESKTSTLTVIAA